MSWTTPLLVVALVWTSACTPTPVERTRSEARELVSAAQQRQGDVQLRCDPEDAEVIVDGIPRGLCSDFDGDPSGLRLSEGFHRIEVKKAGHLPYETSIAPGGARAVLTLRLSPTGSSGGNSEGAGP